MSNNPVTDSNSVEISDEIIELEPEDSTRLDLLAELSGRCATKKVEMKTEQYHKEEHNYTYIGIPSGREKRWLSANGERLKKLLSIPFEKFVFIKGLECICNYEDGTIEAGLRAVNLPSYFALRQLFRAIGAPEDSQAYSLSPPTGFEHQPTYIIGPASETFATLSQSLTGPSRLTLTLSGLNVSQHDQAQEIVEKYANSLFYQIDLITGNSFMLERERIRKFRPRLRKSEIKDIFYPKTEYENALVSLYWYARSARNMPLLQFLGFYQCIEYFFSTFARAEASQRVALLLKDPTFRPDKESDIGKILNAVSINKGGSFGDERTQLRATVNQCVDQEEMKEFFEEDKDRSSFFKAKSKNGLHKIPFFNEGLDIRSDVADRIYSIRCRIVHTKEGDQHGGMILPFSEDADILVYDIELVQFVARKVLIATSSTLN